MTDNFNRLFQEEIAKLEHSADISFWEILILNHIKGIIFFKDLRNFKGVYHNSFESTAVAINLMSDATYY